MWLCTAALTAAMYVALTYLSMALGLDKGAIQLRFSEALIVLAYLMPAAVPGLTVGCFLANLLTGCAPLDIFLGPVATFIGALGAYLIGKMKKRRLSRLLCTVPNILANTVIVSLICVLCYSAPEVDFWTVFPLYLLTVGLSEILSCGVLGTVLLVAAGERIQGAVES